MKKNPMPLFLTITSLVIAAGLLFSGCGFNQARENVEVADEENPATVLDEREAKLDELETTLARNVAELESRLATIEERERQLEQLEDRQATVELPAAPQTLPEPEPQLRLRTITLPAATPLELSIDDALSSETNRVGDPVRATLTRDVVGEGLVALPAGSRVNGIVVAVVPQKKIGGRASLTIAFDEVETRDGEVVPIEALLETAGMRQKKKDAATIGGSAAGGAVLGRILSKDDRTKGTVIGAVLGAAIGTAVASENKGDPVVIEPGMLAAVLLDGSVEVTVLDSGDGTLIAGR